MNMEQTECSETSVYKIQTPGNYPEENIQLSIGLLTFEEECISRTDKFGVLFQDSAATEMRDLRSSGMLRSRDMELQTFRDYISVRSSGIK